MISAHAHIIARKKLGSSLPNQDRAWLGELIGKDFDSQSSSRRITAVGRRSASLFGCHAACHDELTKRRLQPSHGDESQCHWSVPTLLSMYKTVVSLETQPRSTHKEVTAEQQQMAATSIPSAGCKRTRKHLEPIAARSYTVYCNALFFPDTPREELNFPMMIMPSSLQLIGLLLLCYLVSSSAFATPTVRLLSSQMAETVLFSTPPRQPRRNLKKRRKKQDTQSEMSREREFPWETAESRPIVSSKLKEAGEDYWIDEEDLQKSLQRKEAIRNRKVRTKWE